MPLKIDTHQHFWPARPADYPWMGADGLEPLRRDFLPADLAPLLQAHDITATVAVQARGSLAETRWLLELAQNTSWIAGVVGWIDLRAPDVATQIEQWQAHHPVNGGKLVGFRHQVQDEAHAATWLLQPEVTQALERLQRMGFVYELLLQSGQLGHIDKIVSRHTECTLVLDHLGKPPIIRMQDDASHFDHWRQQLAPLRTQQHVMLKLSGLVTEADWQRGPLDAGAWDWVYRCLDAALDIAGPERLLWGSDWPVCTLAAPYQQVFGHFRHWVDTRLSAQEQQAVWSGNAQRCYRLPPLPEPTS